MSKASRRNFLRQVMIGHQSILPDAGAKTLVCVFLRGGADTLNLIAPYGDDQYYKLRPTISLPPPRQIESDQAAIRLDDFYAFHPKLRPLLPLFREGRLGIVQAVGSDNTSGSHFEAQDQMEHGEAYGKTIGGGWIGRYLRTRSGKEMAPLSAPLSAIAIGSTVPESLRGAPSVSALRSLEELNIRTPSGDSRAVSLTLSAMYGAEVGLLSEPGRLTLDLLKRVEKFREREYKPQNNAVYPDDEFGSGLREIARLTKANVGLEVAFIDLGGWDTHFFQGTSDGLQASQIDLLARGLAAFDADLDRDRDRVTVIVLTEFGRRVYENGSLGTDHGRGFAMLAIGSQINGGRVHGEWPGLEEETTDLLGPGGLKISYDYRSVLAEVLRGIMGNRNLSQVFPGFQPQPVGLVQPTKS
jgi:uncharacterized protein (DUF1501 family)